MIINPTKNFVQNEKLLFIAWKNEYVIFASQYASIF